MGPGALSFTCEQPASGNFYTAHGWREAAHWHRGPEDVHEMLPFRGPSFFVSTRRVMPRLSFWYSTAGPALCFSRRTHHSFSRLPDCLAACNAESLGVRIQTEGTWTLPECSTHVACLRHPASYQQAAGKQVLLLMSCSFAYSWYFACMKGVPTKAKASRPLKWRFRCRQAIPKPEDPATSHSPPVFGACYRRKPA